MRRIHHAIRDVHGDDRFPRKLGKICRAQHPCHMVGMVMGEHDEPCLCERALELGELLDEIRLGLVRAEGIVGRLVQAGIDHHRAIGINDLEGRARHRYRRVVTALDHEFARTNARCHSHAVDGERQRAGQDRARHPNGREIRTEIGRLASLCGLGLGPVQRHSTLPVLRPVIIRESG